MRELTKREKILLYLLAVIAVVAGAVMLVILPAQERGNALDEEIFTEQSQLDTMNRLIAQMDGMQRDIADFEANIELEKEHFLPLMNSDDLDKYITGLLQEHGLVAQSLLISADGAQSEDDVVQLYQVDIVARGHISQFVLLAETVKELDGIRIASMSLKEQEIAATPTPSPTPAPKKNRRATPTPELAATPLPTPEDPAYSINITFQVMEYNEDAPLAATAEPDDEAAELTPAP